MSSYPKYLYGADSAVVLVQSAADHAALEGEWLESPADAAKPAEPPQEDKPAKNKGK